MEKINVNDLNGLTQTSLKVITRVIQEANPLKFSEQCEALLNEFANREEIIINYNVSTQIIPAPNGAALLFVAIMQYYASEAEFKEYEAEIKRKNLFI